MINRLPACLTIFVLVTLMIMQKNYSRQDLYMNLMKTIHKSLADVCRERTCYEKE